MIASNQVRLIFGLFLLFILSDVSAETYNMTVEIRHPRRRAELVHKVSGTINIHLKTLLFDQRIEMPIG